MPNMNTNPSVEQLENTISAYITPSIKMCRRLKKNLRKKPI